MSALRLDTPVKFLKGVGERRAEQLERLGIRTARDLLWHLPHRYIDASSVTPLARAEIGQEVACVGRVVAKGVVPTRRGLRIFHAMLRSRNACPGQTHSSTPLSSRSTAWKIRSPRRAEPLELLRPALADALEELDGHVQPEGAVLDRRGGAGA